MSLYTMRVPRKCSERCYNNRVLPVLLKKHVSFHFSDTSFDCLYTLMAFDKPSSLTCRSTI
jgi:hypothetical protein